MHLSTLFLAVDAAVADVQADCYLRGWVWGPDTAQADRVRRDLCNELAYNWKPGKIRYKCVNAETPGSNEKLEFWITNHVEYGPMCLVEDFCSKKLVKLSIIVLWVVVHMIADGALGMYAPEIIHSLDWKNLRQLN